MNYELSAGPIRFCIPRVEGSLVKRLAALASVNSLRAIDIVNRSLSMSLRDWPIGLWVEMLESVGIDPLEGDADELIELAEYADALNQQSVRRIVNKLEERARALGGERLVEEEDEDIAPVKDSKTKRNKLFGHPITAVVRWMGAEGWEFADAKKALVSLDIAIVDATIRAQLRSGVKGDRGEPATLTEEQSDQLYDAAET